MHRVSGRIIRPFLYPVSGLTGYPAGYPADQFGIRPDTGYKKRPDIRCIPTFKQIPGIAVKPNTSILSDIRYRYPALPNIQPVEPDIQYPAFGLAGYPAGRISGNNSIRCINICQLGRAY
jgi:hypothetical protein